VEVQNNNGKLICIIVLLCILVVVLGTYIVYDKIIASEEKGQVIDKKANDEETKENLIIDDDVKEKLANFLDLSYQIQTNVGIPREIDYSNYRMYSPSIMEEYYSGNISKTTKMEMTYAYCSKQNKIVGRVTLSKEEIDAMEGSKPSVSSNGFVEEVSVLSMDDFDKAYEELFQEKANYTLDDLRESGCPMPGAINKKLGKIYLFSNCGGTSAPTTVTCKEDKSYDSDEEYYYVHKSILCSDQDGSSEEHKSDWKFDKNLKFVSASKVA